MNGTIQMTLTGSDADEWEWTIAVNDVVLFSSEPLSTNDLEIGLFQLQRDATRRTPAFDELTPSEAFALLNGFFGGRLYRALQDSADAQTWAKHRVSPSLPSSISESFFLVSRPDGSDDLLIAKADGFQHVRLNGGQFDAEVHRISALVPFPRPD
jgi:hypothetical protein